MSQHKVALLLLAVGAGYFLFHSGKLAYTALTQKSLPTSFSEWGLYGASAALLAGVWILHGHQLKRLV